MKKLIKSLLSKSYTFSQRLLVPIFFFAFILFTNSTFFLNNNSQYNKNFFQILNKKITTTKPQNVTEAENFSPETSIYNFAKCKNNCLLFKTSNINNTNFDNVLFELPNSYFVSIISSTSSVFYKVRYKNFIGFVDAHDIELMNIYPNEPYLENITFGISANSATQLRSTPNSNNQSNILTIIPANTQNINYIAKTSGTIPTGGSSDIWYYAEYTPISDPTSVYQGYVYSEKTTNLSPILLNLETSNLGTNLQNSTEIETDDNIAISPNLKTILIILICLPVVIVFIVSILKTRAQKSSKPDRQTTKTNVENFQNITDNNFQTENSTTSFYTQKSPVSSATTSKNASVSTNNRTSYNCNFLGTFNESVQSNSQNDDRQLYANNNLNINANFDQSPTLISSANDKQKDDFLTHTELNTTNGPYPKQAQKRTITNLKNKAFKRAPTVFETFATSSAYPNQNINFDVLDEDDDLL